MLTLLVKEVRDTKNLKDVDVKEYLRLSKILSELGLGDTLQQQMQELTMFLDEERNRIQRKGIEDTDEYKALLKERDELRRRADNEVISADLQCLRQNYPNVRFENVDELGEVFCLLRVLGLDCLSAYSILRELDARKIPRIGKAAPSSARGEYYTEAELSTLTRAELSKPGVLERALRSLVKK